MSLLSIILDKLPYLHPDPPIDKLYNAIGAYSMIKKDGVIFKKTGETKGNKVRKLLEEARRKHPSFTEEKAIQFWLQETKKYKTSFNIIKGILKKDKSAPEVGYKNKETLQAKILSTLFFVSPDSIAENTKAARRLVHDKKIKKMHILKGNATEIIKAHLNTQKPSKEAKPRLVSPFTQKTELTVPVVPHTPKESGEDLINELNKRITEIGKLFSEQKARNVAQKHFATEKKRTIRKLKRSLPSIERKVKKLFAINETLRARTENRDIDLDKFPPINDTGITEKTKEPRVANPKRPRRITERRIEKSDANAGEKALLAQENSALKKIRDKLTPLIRKNTKQGETNRTLELDEVNVRRQIEHLDDQQTDLLSQNCQLENWVNNTPKQETEKLYDQPLSEIRVWVKKHIPKGHIIILKGAFEEAEKSPYNNPTLIYQCLELLANEYRNLKLTTTDQDRTELARLFNKKALSLYIEDTPSFRYGKNKTSNIKSHTVKDEQGNPVVLDRHLTRGKANNTRETMRIYYTWDESRQAAIIGKMPGHMPVHGF